MLDTDINNNADIALEQAAAEFIDNTIETTQQEEPQETAEVTTETTEEQEIKVEEETSQEENSTEEPLPEDEIIGDAEELERTLSGFVPEYKELVGSIEDPNLKKQVIEAGKKQRAAIDRKLSELGEQKKQNGAALENYQRFDKMFNENPRALLETIAQAANINFNDLVTPAPKSESIDSDLDDYRTPEEIQRDQQIKDLKLELDQLKHERQHEKQLTAQQEIDNFTKAVNEKGELKYPHFDRVRVNMSKIITDDMPLEVAYNKAVMLDDELVAQRDEALIKAKEAKRKARIEKAKKLQKQNPQSSSLDTSVVDPDALLNEAFDKVMMNS